MSSSSLSGVCDGPVLGQSGCMDAAHELDVRAVGLARAIADPQHVGRRVVPVTGRGIDARHRFLIAEQQRLVARVEVSFAQLRRGFRRSDRKAAHEGHCLVDAIGKLGVPLIPQAGRDELKVPAMHLVQVGVAAWAKARSRFSVAADWL